MATASKILEIARSWLGRNEADGSFQEILNVYNSYTPLARGYAIKPTDSWCDAFVSAVAIKAGAVNLIGTEVGCDRHIEIFKSKGIWIEDGTIIPKPGDIILFNWDQNAQPNDGGSDHIGYVEEVDGKIITCIEGNKGEAVSRRLIAPGWGYIRGYARPHYAEESEGDDVDFAKLTDEQVDALVARLNKRLTSLPAADYAKSSCEKAVQSGVFADGDKDGLVDAPQAFLRRQELAAVLDRIGLLSGQKSCR